MSRETILAEIRALERQKEYQPELVHSINAQITALCDKLKAVKAFEPRKVV